MPVYITAAGLEIPSLEDLLTQMQERQRAEIHPLLANGPKSLIGELNATMASHDRESWETIQYGFNALDPRNADDAILEGICLFTGTVREGPKKARFRGTRRLTFNLSPGAQVTAGATIVHVDGEPAKRFAVTETIKNTTLVAADFQVAAEAETPGPLFANANTVQTIATPTFGVNSVVNAFDAIPGEDADSDVELRTRRDEELLQAGSNTTGSLAAELLAFQNEDDERPIISVVVLNNKTDFFDVNGLPPHSFEAVIWDGPGLAADDEEIAIIVARNEPPGIASFGAVHFTNSEIDVRFSRATQRPFEIEITLRVDGTAYAGDAAVKEALAAKAVATQKPGGIIAFSAYIAAAIRDVAGVNRVEAIEINTVGSIPVPNSDVVLAAREVGVTDTTLITVVSSVGL